jgi:mono/diheme cytochrome c family protein
MKKIFLLITSIACCSLFLIAAKDNTMQDKKKGKEVYSLNCQSCHMENGEGLEGVYPPLAKTSYLKDTKKIIDVILNGQFGEVTVNGKKYNTDMPAQAYLSNEQIADVLTYIRSSWSNKYPAVTPAQVKAQRK